MGNLLQTQELHAGLGSRLETTHIWVDAHRYVPVGKQKRHARMGRRLKSLAAATEIAVFYLVLSAGRKSISDATSSPS